MRVTLLGHASLLVELDGATCLMDPSLAAKHEVDHQLQLLDAGSPSGV